MTGTQTTPSAARDILRGILICLTGILIHQALPLTGIFIWLFLPLPVFFYRLKAGRKAGAVIASVPLTLLIAVNGNILANLFYYGFFLVTGFVLGEYIEQMMGIERTVLSMVLTLTALTGVLLFIYSLMIDKSIPQLFTQLAEAYKTSSRQFFSAVNNAYPQAQLDLDQLEKTNSVFLTLMPAVWFNWLVSMAWLNILCIKKLLKKHGIVISTIKNLDHWKSPDILIAGLILSGIMLFIPNDSLNWIAMNCLFILIFVYFLQGLAVASYYFYQKRTPAIIRFFFTYFRLFNQCLHALSSRLAFLITGLISENWMLLNNMNIRFR